VLQGTVTTGRSFARLLAPTRDFAAIVAELKDKPIPRIAQITDRGAESKFDPALLLATVERRTEGLARSRDEELKVAVHQGGPMHVHIAKTEVPGVYHVGVYVDGTYCADYSQDGSTGGHDHGGGMHGFHAAAIGTASADCPPERFIRILTTMVGLPPAGTVVKFNAMSARGGAQRRRKPAKRGRRR
jgi:hypothetical protein